MAWIKVPPENHAKFQAALPEDRRIELKKMFGGIALKVNGRIFGGLYGRSVMLVLPPDLRAEALALQGAGPFDPMQRGRIQTDKVQMPERMMDVPKELRAWIHRALEAAAGEPKKKRPQAIRNTPTLPSCAGGRDSFHRRPPRASRGGGKVATRLRRDRDSNPG